MCERIFQISNLTIELKKTFPKTLDILKIDLKKMMIIEKITRRFKS